MNIHVIGDSVLDEDYQVSASRISPECANIIVLESEHTAPIRTFPGGAANVCCQLKNFVVQPRLFSFLDSEAWNAFKNMGINFWGKLDLPNGCYIPRKKRFYDADFQVGCRWDIEKKNYGLSNIDYYRSKLMELWSAFQAEPDVIVFSDYDKGLFGDYVKIPDNVPTIVDPKEKPVSKWRGCTIFKPNAQEAVKLSEGLTDWVAQSNFFQKELDCKAVVITQAGSGVVGKIDGRHFSYIPKKKIHPFQTSGAGDCFTAMVALAIAYEFDIYTAVSIAFEISSLYVQYPNRTFIAPWHLGVKDMCPKLLKNRDFKLVFTNGCFDILHTGHLSTLKFAKSKGDKLLVAVNSDESVKQLKGSDRPINILGDRMEVLKAIEDVDFVVPFKELEPAKLIEKIKPDILVKGSDYQDKDVSGSEFVDKVYFAPFLDGKSTTDIIKSVAKYHV